MFSKSRMRSTTHAAALPAHKVDPSELIHAVGDIHGCFDLLMAMMEDISADIARFSDDCDRRIIFLGDYVNRGDQSREVVEMLSDIASIRERLKVEARVQIDFLADKHEIALLNFLDGPVPSADWLKWGGLQALASFVLKTRLKLS